jgi:uncharacterized membrane protein YdjX (TVP38/TMEM64 family)
LSVARSCDPSTRGARALSDRARWTLFIAAGVAVVGLIAWLVAVEAPPVRAIVRIYSDKQYLKQLVASWGWMAPIVFIVIQALQVIVSPVPGEITGPVGGALFGTLWGMVYSTIGLTLGTLVCFGLGRKWGEPLVRPWLSEHHWNRMSFILEAEGVILCFILYLIPGFPKDIISYLFGISPMPFWLFALVSTAARIPGTAISSYFGANVAEQQYIYAIAFIAVITALCLPLYYYRDRIIRRFHPKSRRRDSHREA